MNRFDIVKFRTLIHVYKESLDEQVRQRALVGWVLAIDDDWIKVYPEMRLLTGELLGKSKVLDELTELQMQLIYTACEREDTMKIREEIMPDLIKNNSFKMTQEGLVEQNDDPLEDVLHPDAVSILLQAIQAHHADVAIGSFVVFDGKDVNWPTITNEKTVRHYDSQAALKAIYYQDKLTNSSCWRLFKASLFDDVRYPVGKYYEDLAIVYPLYKKCSLVVGIDDAVYGYRQRNDSILGRFSLKRADVLDICEQLERQVQTEDVELLHAVRSRLLSAYFNILLLSYQDKEQDFKELQDRCWKGIKRLRHNCLIDSNVRPKNKAGIIASYLGRTFLCDILGKRYHPKR